LKPSKIHELEQTHGPSSHELSHERDTSRSIEINHVVPLPHCGWITHIHTYMNPLPSQCTPKKHCVTMVILQITIQSRHVLSLRFLLDKEDTSISELTNQFMFNTLLLIHILCQIMLFFIYEIFAF